MWQSSGFHQSKLDTVISLNLEQKTSYDKIDLLPSFAHLQNKLIKKKKEEAEGAICANRAQVISLQITDRCFSPASSQRVQLLAVQLVAFL